MEAIAVIAVIVVLCIVLGVKAIYLLFAAVILMAAGFVLSMLLLAFFFVRLLFSKKHKSVFSRIDQSPRNKFRVAFYKIDGTEYPNIFPVESFLHSRLYRTDREYTVFLSRNKNFVFDRFACITCTTGTIIGISCAVAAVRFFIS